MKRFSMMCLVTLTLTLLLLTACGDNGRVPPSDNADSDPTMGSDLLSSMDNASAVDTEKAKVIALEHAGLSAQDVDFIHAEIERDDGVDEIHVEFRVGNVEYDYEIDPQTGNILSYESNKD